MNGQRAPTLSIGSTDFVAEEGKEGMPVRKKQPQTTHCLHQRSTQKQSRNNALPSPVVYAKSHATTRCLHQWYTQIATQQRVAFTSGIRKNSHATTRCLHQRYAKK